MDNNIIVMLGPQGSGKGTQAKILSKKLNIPNISTGELLRQEIEKGSELGKKVENIVNGGGLIPDELLVDLAKKRIEEKDCEKGFIFDGSPRTIKQVKLFSKFLEINKIIEIHISEEESIKRLTNRRQCLQCGAIYNLYTAPKPKEDELCDKCKVKLVQRDDDKEERIRNRLNLYHKQTKPVLEHYKDELIKINGEQSIEKVAEDIEKFIM